MQFSKTKMIWISMIISLGFMACNVFYRMPQFLAGSDQARTENSEQSSLANGERIYYTATNQDGERITYRGGPNFGGMMMMGTYLTCAACHGPEARGGTHVMHMQIMNAPDIRYAALQGEAGEHGGEEHHEGAEEYSLDDFRQAVVAGKHPDGESLDRDMPRWEMDDQDLADLFDFLKSLP